MIQWPARYAPQVASVHVRNELAMPVSRELVWAWLIRAELWPAWYGNSANVRIKGGGPDLNAGSVFTWKTFGVALKSQVLEFVPGERIAWNALAIGIDAYHAWEIESRPGGCFVVTEETQHGLIAGLGHIFMPKRMGRYHQMWLEGLLIRSQSGLPPPASARAGQSV